MSSLRRPQLIIEPNAASSDMFSGDDISSKLEFSINMDMLSDHRPSICFEASQQHIDSSVHESTQSKRISLRDLVRSHARRSEAGNSVASRAMHAPMHMVTERSDMGGRNSAQSMSEHTCAIQPAGNDENASNVHTNVGHDRSSEMVQSKYQLQLGNFPSPLTSLGSEIFWAYESQSTNESILSDPKMHQNLTALCMSPLVEPQDNQHIFVGSIEVCNIDSQEPVLGIRSSADNAHGNDVASPSRDNNLDDAQVCMMPYVEGQQTSNIKRTLSSKSLSSLDSLKESIIQQQRQQQVQHLDETAALKNTTAAGTLKHSLPILQMNRLVRRSSLASLPATTPAAAPLAADSSHIPRKLQPPDSPKCGAKIAKKKGLFSLIGAHTPAVPAAAISAPLNLIETPLPQPSRAGMYAADAENNSVLDMRGLDPSAPPQRRSSLMFSPMIDMAAEPGALIDTMSGANIEHFDPQLGTDISDDDDLVLSSPVAVHQRIMKSLRHTSHLSKSKGASLISNAKSNLVRVKTSSSSHPLCHNLRKAKRAPHRGGLGSALPGGKKTSSNNGLYKIDTTQPDPNTHTHIRTPATLPIARRPGRVVQDKTATPKNGNEPTLVAPKLHANETNDKDGTNEHPHVQNAQPDDKEQQQQQQAQQNQQDGETQPNDPANPPEVPEPAQTPAATPAETPAATPTETGRQIHTPVLMTRLKDHDTSVNDNPRKPGGMPLQQPQQQQPVHSQDEGSLANEASMLGYVPIAVSLKSSRSRQFLLNTPLGEFEVQKTLGQGSYGKVKLMRSAMTNEQFAVKIIKRYPPHKHRRGHQEYRKAKTLDRRVVREANLAAILGQLHPHIVPLHDFRVTDTHFYLFYSYVNGVTLAERVGTNGLSESEARAIFKPVAETINFCHQYSVIHRDIKLENVLIDYADDAEKARPLLTGSSLALSSHRTANSAGTPGVPMLSGLDAMIGRKSTSGNALGKKADGNRGSSNTGSGGNEAQVVDYRTASIFDGCIKIIDFGLANFFDGASLMETFCGSLPYTAPEILRGDAYVGPEIDVWSLGVLLYVMLTGQFPFDDPAQVKNFDKIMAGDFPLRPTMSRSLQDLLVRMLEPNSKKRITMQGVLTHEWLQNRNAPSIPDSHEASSVSPVPTTSLERSRYKAPPPGICCTQHPFAITDAIHDRRTLILPGPHVNPLVAREVATCLDRSVDEVVRTLEAAMSNGEMQSKRRRSSQIALLSDSEHHTLPSLIQHWPCALQGFNDSSTLVEVANSPVVSVYALISQQINMRRYYLELPATEHADINNAGDSTPLNSSQFTQFLDATCSALPELTGEAGHYRARAASTAALSQPKSQKLMHRLSAHIDNLISYTGCLLGGATTNIQAANQDESKAPRRLEPKFSPQVAAPDQGAAVPSCTAPQPIAGTSMPLLTTKPNERRHSIFNLPAHATKVFNQHNLHRHGRPSFGRGRKAPEQAGNGLCNSLSVRSIGALENMSNRITLPSDLTSASAEAVLGLVSKLLRLHEITHTFVEAKKMPMQKALNTSVFSLKTIAAMMSSVNQSTPQMLPANADYMYNADLFMKNNESMYMDAQRSIDVIDIISSDDHSLRPLHGHVDGIADSAPILASGDVSGVLASKHGQLPHHHHHHHHHQHAKSKQGHRDSRHLKALFSSVFSRSQATHFSNPPDNSFSKPTINHGRAAGGLQAKKPPAGKTAEMMGSKRGFDLEVEHSAKSRFTKLFGARPLLAARMAGDHKDGQAFLRSPYQLSRLTAKSKSESRKDRTVSAFRRGKVINSATKCSHQATSGKAPDMANLAAADYTLSQHTISHQSTPAKRRSFIPTDAHGIGPMAQCNIDMPSIVTTIPVNYATPVIFAQYSPSLNRWRETEVVEYYSCAVRIELVRIGGTDLRHRYALLIDRMTGHKGKFALFKMFMRRMVSALPSLEPEVFEPRPMADPFATVARTPGLG